MAKITKHQFISGALWKVLEQFSAKGLSMVFGILLARLLAPEDYGLIALTVVFTNLADILIDGGFSTALIRKETVDEYDFSSVWLISMGAATVLYTAIFFLAPAVSRYYGQPALTAVLRVISLLLFLQGFSAVRTAWVSRNLQFKLLFQCNLLGTAVSGVLGIAAALSGAGVWALVVQRLSQQGLLTALLMKKLDLKTAWKFRFSRIRQLLGFSAGVVGSSLLSYLGSSLYSLIIGKRYSVEELGYYDKGGQLPTQLSLYTFGAMSNVLLPTLAAHQTQKERMKQITRRVVQMTVFLIAPMMAGLAAVAQEAVVLLFTEKWLPIVPILQWNCLYYFATPLMLINVQVFFALGCSARRVKAELLRLGLMVPGALILGAALRRPVTELALYSAAVAVASEAVTYLDVRRLLDYRFRERLADLLLPCLCAGVMGLGVFAAGQYLLPPGAPPFLSLLAKAGIGAVLYGLLSAALRLPGFGELRQLLRPMKKGGTP